MSLNKYLSEKIKILSFLLTVLIVVLHANMAMLCTGGVSFFQDVMTAEVTRIVVPLFYLISGFLFFINYRNTWADFKRKLCARTRSLLIPYLLFLVCGSIFMLAIKHIYTIDVFWITIRNAIFSSPPIFYHLWFLRDLYIMALFAPIVYWMIKKFPIFLILLIVVWILGKNPILFPMTESMLFFCLGALLSTKVQWLERRDHKCVWGYVFLWLLLCFLNVYVRKYIIALPYATHCLILLLGVYTIWILYDKLYPRFSKCIKSPNVYKYTFFIYLLHEPILTIIKKIGISVLGNSSWTIGVIYLISPIFTIVVLYGIGQFLNAYLPNVLAFITGGRSTRT